MKRGGGNSTSLRKDGDEEERRVLNTGILPSFHSLCIALGVGVDYK